MCVHLSRCVAFCFLLLNLWSSIAEFCCFFRGGGGELNKRHKETLYRASSWSSTVNLKMMCHVIAFSTFGWKMSLIHQYWQNWQKNMIMAGQKINTTSFSFPFSCSFNIYVKYFWKSFLFFSFPILVIHPVKVREKEKNKSWREQMWPTFVWHIDPFLWWPSYVLFPFCINRCFATLAT